MLISIRASGSQTWTVSSSAPIGARSQCRWAPTPFVASLVENDFFTPPFHEAMLGKSASTAHTSLRGASMCRFSSIVRILISLCAGWRGHLQDRTTWRQVVNVRRKLPRLRISHGLACTVTRGVVTSHSSRSEASGTHCVDGFFGLLETDPVNSAIDLDRRDGVAFAHQTFAERKQ